MKLQWKRRVLSLINHVIIYHNMLHVWEVDKTLLICNTCKWFISWICSEWDNFEEYKVFYMAFIFYLQQKEIILIRKKGTKTKTTRGQGAFFKKISHDIKTRKPQNKKSQRKLLYITNCFPISWNKKGQNPFKKIWNSRRPNCRPMTHFVPQQIDFLKLVLKNSCIPCQPNFAKDDDKHTPMYFARLLLIIYIFFIK